MMRHRRVATSVDIRQCQAAVRGRTFIAIGGQRFVISMHCGTCQYVSAEVQTENVSELCHNPRQTLLNSVNDGDMSPRIVVAGSR